VGKHEDDIRIEQRFWRAEVRDRTVVTSTSGYHSNNGTSEKTYPTREAAERAARADYAKKLRVGFVPIPDAELHALMRHVFKVGIRGEGSRVKRDVGKPSKNVAYACRCQKFWRGRRDDATVTISAGDIGGKVETTTAKYPDDDRAWHALNDARWKFWNACVYESAPKELTAIERYVKAMNRRLARLPADAPADLPPPETPTPTIIPRRRGARAAAKVKRTGPFADAFTSPRVHDVKLARAKASKPGAPPRATSGGRPIMAEGQAWPTCGGCGERLALYLQFDIAPEMQLGFIPGSHLLVFNCPGCEGLAKVLAAKRLPKEWLSPDHPQTYRVILNRPAAREAVFPADETVLEQRVTLRRGTEKVTPLYRDGSPDAPPRGRDGFKIGGIPRRLQDWTPPRCHCGAPLGFVFQVPLTVDPGWRSKGSKEKRPLGFFGGDVFIHACTKQCSPYATIVVPDR
jgi:hypothetical protein